MVPVPQGIILIVMMCGQKFSVWRHSSCGACREATGGHQPLVVQLLDPGCVTQGLRGGRAAKRQSIVSVHHVRPSRPSAASIWRVCLSHLSVASVRLSIHHIRLLCSSVASVRRVRLSRLSHPSVCPLRLASPSACLSIRPAIHNT